MCACKGRAVLVSVVYIVSDGYQLCFWVLVCVIVVRSCIVVGDGLMA